MKLLYALFLLTILYRIQELDAKYIVEHLCYGPGPKILSHFGSTASLTSMGAENVDCQILVLPNPGNSLILSIRSYDLDADEMLTIEDSDYHKVGIVGSREFSDEKKSIVSGGSFKIRYTAARKHTEKLNFRFLFTQVHDKPCGSNEFECSNRKCIASSLVCDHHNNCGDLSDEEDCYLRKEPSTTSANSSSGIILSVVIGVSILIIAVVVGLAFVIRNLVRNMKEQEPLPHVVPDIPVLTPTAPPAGYFTRLRNSLRSGTRQEEEVQPPIELHQVPSMYPSTADVSGIDNAQFKVDE